MDTEQRRFYLRVVVKLMLLIFIIALLTTFVRSISTNTQSAGSNRVSIDLSPLQTGQSMRYDWHGKRVFILKRDVIDVTNMQSLNIELLDPDSRHSRQPATTENRLRSVHPGYFVVLDYGTDLNCGLDYLNKNQAGPEGRVWLGGFKDLCRGSWYDLTGRVYKGQQAKRNLTIPVYDIEDQSLILGSE